MGIREIRRYVAEAYPGKHWREKVDFMPNNQVFAIYRSIIERKKKKKAPPVLKEPINDGVQLNMFDILEDSDG